MHTVAQEESGPDALLGAATASLDHLTDVENEECETLAEILQIASYGIDGIIERIRRLRSASRSLFHACVRL
jgi:hypothetical protein